jgi:uncharacterized protein YbaP (TraB family)
VHNHLISHDLKFRALLGLAALCATAWTPFGGVTGSVAASDAPPPAAEPEAPIEQVEVLGERAGPSLWRVSKDDHVLWLLGTLDPLPKRMTWRSREVESVLQEAQEVLPSNPAISANVGPISAIRLYMQWRRTEKIPEKSKLQDWLTPSLYARFSALKSRYDPHDTRIDELRPMFAARRLYERAIDYSGLTERNDIQDAVLKLAKRHQVNVHRTALRIEDPHGVLNEVGEIPRDAEIGCLEATVERLETDLDAMKARARAWSLGDVDELRRLPFPSQRQVCQSAVTTSPRIRELIARANNDWNAALEDALARNRVTLALKPVYDLMGPQGVLARLRAKGYAVEGP